MTAYNSKYTTTRAF